MAVSLNITGHLSSLHNSIVPDTFRPLHLRYLSFSPLDNSFKLLLDKGSLKNPSSKEIEVTSKTLMQYFLIGLTLPNDTFWVNLRPDSPDQIIDDRLAQTDIGKIMLETDLQLKKDTASFTSPQTPEGKEYWDKLYKKAEELYGTDNVTIPTLTRPWIVPGEIIIRETTDSAYIYKATLKVMLEQDYLKTTPNALTSSTDYTFKDQRSRALNEYSTQLIKEIIIPKLTKEVNSSKRYASLRQVYYSLILAQWFKARFKGKQGSYYDRIDRQDLTNFTSKEDWSKDTYFNAYKQSFADGEYNIQEPVYTPTGQVIRSYFSGGTIINLVDFPQIGEQAINGASIATLPGNSNLAVNRETQVLDFKLKDDSQSDAAVITEEIKVEEVDAGQKKLASSALKSLRLEFQWLTEFISKSAVFRKIAQELSRRTSEGLKEHSIAINEQEVGNGDDPESRIVEGDYTRATGSQVANQYGLEIHTHPNNLALPSDGDLEIYRKRSDIAQMIIAGNLAVLLTDVDPRFPVLRYNMEPDKLALLREYTTMKVYRLQRDAKGVIINIVEISDEEWQNDMWLFLNEIGSLSDKDPEEHIYEITKNAIEGASDLELRRWLENTESSIKAAFYEFYSKPPDFWSLAFSGYELQEFFNSGWNEIYWFHQAKRRVARDTKEHAEVLRFMKTIGFLLARRQAITDIFKERGLAELSESSKEFEQYLEEKMRALVEWKKISNKFSRYVALMHRVEKALKEKNEDAAKRVMRNAQENIGINPGNYKGKFMNYPAYLQQIYDTKFPPQLYINRLLEIADVNKRYFSLAKFELEFKNFIIPNLEVASSALQYKNGESILNRLLKQIRKFFINAPLNKFTKDQENIIKNKIGFLVKVLFGYWNKTKQEEIQEKFIHEVLPDSLFYRAIRLERSAIIDIIKIISVPLIPVFILQQFSTESYFSNNLALKAIFWFGYLYYTLFGRTMFGASAHAKKSFWGTHAFIPLASSDTQFTRRVVHEAIHLFRYNHLIKADIPVAAGFGDLSRFRDYGKQDKWFKLGRRLLREFSDPKDRWKEILITLQKSYGGVKFRNTEELFAYFTDIGALEEKWTYPLGGILAGMAEAIAEKTGLPDAAWAYLALIARPYLGQGVFEADPIVAEELIISLSEDYLKEPTDSEIDFISFMYLAIHLASLEKQLEVMSKRDISTSSSPFTGNSTNSSLEPPGRESLSLPRTIDETAASPVGGIDFRSLPIVTQAMTNLSANISSSVISRLSGINLDEEWQAIKRIVSSGIKPSAERIKEYAQASSSLDRIVQDKDKMILCIADILRREEEQDYETDPVLRDILVVLESIQQPQALKEVFLGKAIL